ncbi:MAG: hypothetical protein KatS3mg008_1701 [Acidimicrobiales bacterium]|nr:MAG: hypothetical protein KatS3mg008_1701 [Acidimicrobiales bacterium]
MQVFDSIIAALANYDKYLFFHLIAEFTNPDLDLERNVIPLPIEDVQLMMSMPEPKLIADNASMPLPELAIRRVSEASAIVADLAVEFNGYHADLVSAGILRSNEETPVLDSDQRERAIQLLVERRRSYVCLEESGDLKWVWDEEDSMAMAQYEGMSAREMIMMFDDYTPADEETKIVHGFIPCSSTGTPILNPAYMNNDVSHYCLVTSIIHEHLGVVSLTERYENDSMDDFCHIEVDIMHEFSEIVESRRWLVFDYEHALDDDDDDEYDD